MSEVEVAAVSSAEIAFRRHGLEFARARLAHEPGSFRSTSQIVFGVGAQERVLSEQTSQPSCTWYEASARYVIPRARAIIRYGGCIRNAGWNRWSCKTWRRSMNAWIQPALYSQVPAFSASDRAMIDVLTVTRDGRLAVVELKADEDIHLPLQGLDYWSRVAWHHARGEFQRFGYFPARELSADKPLLFLVAPALHVHPATDTLLHYISPQIDWALLGIDERWRTAYGSCSGSGPRERCK